MNQQPIDKTSFLDFVGQILPKLPPKSVGRYAALSFLEVAGEMEDKAIDESDVRFWLVSMLMDGKKSGTCTRYIRKMHSFFKDWQKATDTSSDPFVGIENLYDSSCEPSLVMVNNNLACLKRMLAKDEESADWQLISIFFFLLYDVSASLADVVTLKFDGVVSYCPQLDDIVSGRDSSFGREYVFNLNQSHARHPQIERVLNENLFHILSAVGMTFDSSFSRSDITALWIALAIKAGMDLRTIRNVLPTVPLQFKALTLLEKVPVTEDEKREVICKVADFVNSNALRWFVMKLRPRVTFDEVNDSIRQKFPGNSFKVELFYPTHAIYKRKGKKTVRKDIPYVPDILFFRTRQDRVQRLFSKIGDLAWCYKWSNTPESGYSTISQEDMRHFQQAIGEFTSDIRVELVDLTTEYKIGDTVSVTGGVMKGFAGSIESIDSKSGSKIFLLRISNDKGLKITHEVSSEFIESFNSTSPAKVEASEKLKVKS